jgi:hypothetical protein
VIRRYRSGLKHFNPVYKGVKLTELRHPGLMKASGWQWSTRKRDADAARWAGFRLLSEFEQLPKDDRLDVLALYEIDWKQHAIDGYEKAEEEKRGMNKPRRK